MLMEVVLLIVWNVCLFQSSVIILILVGFICVNSKETEDVLNQKVIVLF